MTQNFEEQLDLLKQKIEIIDRGSQLEFDKIADSFKKLSSLTDLLYLEVATMLEVLSKKKILTEKEFAENLEVISKRMQEDMKKHIEKMKEKKEKSPIIMPGTEKKDEPKTAKNN